MAINREEIVANLCYTELLYGRINRKLNSHRSKREIEEYLLEVLENTEIKGFSKIGKNYYVSNAEYQIRITINSNSYRVITVDKIS